MLSSPMTTILGADPSLRASILNGNTFQQDAILSFAGWQYAVFYSPKPGDLGHKILLVHLARRKLPNGDWDHIVFDDYEQTTDDGHNTAQMGICAGDGTIHLSFDHHCDRCTHPTRAWNKAADTAARLKYRNSVKGLANSPLLFHWSARLFSPISDQLPGLSINDYHFDALTYPRFGFLGDDMFFSIRNGQAGQADGLLYIYRAATASYEFVGMHLKGVNNNPYVHGMDCRSGRLQVTWVYRGFVYYKELDDPHSSVHKQNAGPNGPDNNYNICYAYSDDGGYTWKNGQEQTIARLTRGESVLPDSPGIVAFDIPKGCGLMNQESQAVDHDGGIHVLNRCVMGGQTVWIDFYRAPSGEDTSAHHMLNVKLTLQAGSWAKSKICAAPTNSRGSIAASRDGDIYVTLPHPTTRTLKIYKSSKRSGFLSFSEVWAGQHYVGEPLIDRERLLEEGVLSVLNLYTAINSQAERSVVVLDFKL